MFIINHMVKFISINLETHFWLWLSETLYIEVLT